MHSTPSINLDSSVGCSVPLVRRLAPVCPAGWLGGPSHALRGRRVPRARGWCGSLLPVSVGENTGGLDGMLRKVAELYEEEVDDAVANLTALMEPMIMVVLGVILVWPT